MIGSEWTWQNWILCQSSHVTMSKRPSCLTWVHQKDPTKRWNLYWLNWALLSKLRWQTLHFDLIEKKKLFYKLRMFAFPSRWTAKRKAIDYLAVMYVRCILILKSIKSNAVKSTVSFTSISFQKTISSIREITSSLIIWTYDLFHELSCRSSWNLLAEYYTSS